MPAGTTSPIDNGAERWQQRSTRAAARPSPSRKRTTGSLQMRRASGFCPTSSAQAAMYQALRMNIVSSRKITRRRHARFTLAAGRDRKSTRLNSSHVAISYAVFCLKKKKKNFTIYFYNKKKKKIQI